MTSTALRLSSSNIVLVTGARQSNLPFCRAKMLVSKRTCMNSKISDANAASLAVALQRTASGDRAAFEEVYRRTSLKLFGVCLRILPVRQEAEEALQEAYISVWRRAGSFDPARGTAMTWLITLTRNRAVDRLRASGRFAAVPIELAGEVADPSPTSEDALVMNEGDQRLAYCLGTLETGDAGLIRTAFFDGSTYAELATRTSTPLGTIKSRIRRALLKLRDCLR